MTTVKKTDSTKGGGGYGLMKIHIYCTWEDKLVTTIWKTFWQLSTEAKLYTNSMS